MGCLGDGLFLLTRDSQLLFPGDLHHRLYTLPARHCGLAQRVARPDYRADTALRRAGAVVSGCRCEYFGGLRGRQGQGRVGGVSALLVLHWHGLLVLHFVRAE